MKFGVREICDVVLRAKSVQTLGNRTFYKNEPVLYFDTLKTSSLEGAATTVYATGGKGNSRLVAWEGERTLTFTFEDALISPEGFAILSGAGLVTPEKTADKALFVHTTTQVVATDDETFVLDTDKVCWNKGRKNTETDTLGKLESIDNYHAEADIFVMVLDANGEIVGEPCVPREMTVEEGKTTILCCGNGAGEKATAPCFKKGDVVLVDYYVKRTTNAMQIEITADSFAGNYYLEASTLFRRESDGVDMPAEFIIPNGKIQSNFNFAMASSGDPSTFTFTMDAFPDYTKFDRTRKVLAAIQVITGEEVETGEKAKEFREICKHDFTPSVEAGE